MRHIANQSLADRRTSSGPQHVCFDPGFIEKYQLRRINPELPEAPCRAPFRDIAAPVCFLLSDEAGFMTGTMTVPDGGETLL